MELPAPSVHLSMNQKQVIGSFDISLLGNSCADIQKTPMSELQAALNRWDSERSEDVIRRINSTSDDVDLFVVTARMWLNPNIPAAMGRFYKLWNGDNDLSLDEIWAEAVTAALTPQGDTK